MTSQTFFYAMDDTWLVKDIIKQWLLARVPLTILLLGATVLALPSGRHQLGTTDTITACNLAFLPFIVIAILTALIRLALGP